MEFFWIIIAISYFFLSIISFLYNRLLDKKFEKAKDDIKKDYGFKTYGVYEIILKYSATSTLINIIGGILASAAAIVSYYTQR
jgi:hypothetical protein